MQTRTMTTPVALSEPRWQVLQRLPPTYFAMPLGLSGLAGVWRLASTWYGWPLEISLGILALATLVGAMLAGGVLLRLIRAPDLLRIHLTHATFSPFTALVPLTFVALAAGWYPIIHRLAQGVFLLSFGGLILLAGWLLGQWIVGEYRVASYHYGYLLPTVAGPLIGAEAAAHIGLVGLGWASLGVGLLSWLLLGATLLSRAFFEERIPPPLVPTFAIQLAPAVVGGNAYLALNGGHLDPIADGLGGYAVLMVLVQLRLIPWYRRTPFTAGFWAFTFPYAAAVANALRWLHLLAIKDAPVLGGLLLAVLTFFISGIAWCSLRALAQGTFFPPMVQGAEKGQRILVRPM